MTVYYSTEGAGSSRTATGRALALALLLGVAAMGCGGEQGDSVDAGAAGDAGPSGPTGPARAGQRSGEVLAETPSYALDLLLDGETLYYTTTEAFGHQAALWRVPKAGGTAERLHQGPGEFWRLAQDETAVYAAAASAKLVFRWNKTAASSGAVQVLEQGRTTTGAIVRVGEQLYFGADDGVYAVPTTGGTAGLFARSDPPTELASWGGQLVWTSWDTDRVWLQRLDATPGGQAQIFSEHYPRPYAIAASEDGVFWISGGTKPLGEDGLVLRQGWDWSDAWVLSPIAGGIGLKMSGKSVYTSFRGFSLQSAVPSQDKAAVVMRPIVMGYPMWDFLGTYIDIFQTFILAADGYMYWTDFGGGYVRRKASNHTGVTD